MDWTWAIPFMIGWTIALSLILRNQIKTDGELDTKILKLQGKIEMNEIHTKYDKQELVRLTCASFDRDARIDRLERVVYECKPQPRDK